MLKMRAALMREIGKPFEIADLEAEEPRADEIVVRVVAAGVCHTDIVVRDGVIPAPLPAVLGHEGAGVVERVGVGVRKVKPGDHVVMTFDACGTCPSCRDHATTYCHQSFQRNFGCIRTDGTSALSQAGSRINGHFFGQSSFATYAICGEMNVIPVPGDVPLELLGPLACGVQTGAGAALNSLAIRPGKSFAVFGAGSVGLSAVLGARVAAAGRIIAVDLNEERLELAREFGATETVNPSKEDATARVMELTGYGVDYALDTTGLESVIHSALAALAPRGTLGILGASDAQSHLTIRQGHLRGAGRKIMGIVEGDSNPYVFIPLMIDLWRQGRFPFDRMIRFYDFEDINQAVHDSETGVTIKPVLRMAAN